MKTLKNNYDETWVVLDSKHKASVYARSFGTKNLKRSRGGILEVAEVVGGKYYEEGEKPDHYIAWLCGGLNGEKKDGKWKMYLEEIGNFLTDMDNCWLIDLENDCCDDIWYAHVGFRLPKNDKE